MSDLAVDVQGVSKRFRLHHERATILEGAPDPRGQALRYEDFWALDGMSTSTVDEGETVGILGHNGSGKSTLLKCICGVLQPTQGEVVVRGKLAGLLELGAGFQPELTGRDNIYLNGSMLGLSKRGGRQGLRRHRRLLRARAVHRQPGEVLLVGHVRAAGLRGRGERGPRHPGGRRGPGRRATSASSASASTGSGVPGARAGPSSLVTHSADQVKSDLRPGGRAQPRRDDRRRHAGPGRAGLPRAASSARRRCTRSPTRTS